VTGGASWRPDPTGRHEYRWWDGVGWADEVADGEVVSRAPIGAARPTVPAEPVKGRNSWPWLALVALVAAAVVVGTVVVVRRDRASGVGLHDAALIEGRPWTTDLHLGRGDMIRVRTEPGTTDLDLQLAVLVDDDLADELVTALLTNHRDELDDVIPGPAGAVTEASVREQFFTSPATVLPDLDPLVGELPGEVYVFADAGGPGAPEANWFIADVPGTYRVVVLAPSRSGDARLIAERAPSVYPGTRLYDPAVLEDDPFFEDPAFYSGVAPYTPTPE
jgi:hypothetical protein